MREEQTIDGFTFYRDPKTKYFLGAVNGKRMRLHQYIWVRENGPIPKGYDVHHIDFNKENNSIDNLTLLTRSEHHSLHGKIVPTKVIKCKVCGTIAIRRHNSLFCSDACKSKWRREVGIDDITVTCHACGKEFKKNKHSVNQSRKKNKLLFCSHSCASKWQIAHGLMPMGWHGYRKVEQQVPEQEMLAI